MNRLRFIFFLLLMINFYLGCNSNNSEKNKHTLRIEDELKLQEGELALIYYFDGDCSLCFHRINLFKQTFTKDTEFNNVQFKAIGISNNVDLFRHNMNLFDLDDLIILDSNDNFYKNNGDIALLNNTYLVNARFEVEIQYEAEDKFEELVDEMSKDIKTIKTRSY